MTPEVLNMAKQVTVTGLRQLLDASSDDMAVIDVREVAEYNLAHIAGSCSIPRRQIEFRLTNLVPWQGTRIVVCDDDGVRANLAAATLESRGYTDVSILSGGLNRWVTEGKGTEWGLNVPSKDFGERVLLQQDIPELEPDELAAWLAEGKQPIILDSRTPEEHHRACIPGSRSMPGAELGLRIWDLAQDPKTPVVVHCAGRTRSIIGAGTLKRLGVPNVYALKNGTMGWQLAGLELDTGSNRLALPPPTPEGRQHAEHAAREVAQVEGVRFVDVQAARQILASSGNQNVYAIDVRSREEYAAGHIPGFAWIPGGQAVQATDNFVAVRDGGLLFACDGIVRAAMTASWFRQMGHPNVYALDGGKGAWQADGLTLETGMPDETPFGLNAAQARVEMLSPSQLNDQHTTAASTLIFVGTSDEFSRGHVPGSHWLSRSWLEPRIAEFVLSKSASIVLTCADGVSATLAAATLLDLGYEHVAALAGGLDAWTQAGLPVETGLTGVTDPPNDVLPVRRSYAEMLNYLRWEEELGEKYLPAG
jgi:rhodanese-related sulfurtransferase